MGFINGDIKMGELFFGRMPDGDVVTQITLENIWGWKANIITLGAIVKNLEIPDRNGRFSDILLGQDTLGDYLKNMSASAALIGRVANRIENASFSLNGKTYQLEANENGNCLHSAGANYGGRNFQVVDYGKNWVALNLKDDETGGFPGRASLDVKYTLTNCGAFEIEYRFQADKDTPVNLTNHAYFNLSGGTELDVLNHDMRLNAEFYTPLGKDMIPTGEIRRCDSQLDFTSRRQLSEVLHGGFGLDHNFVLSNEGFSLAGELWNEHSGRKMSIYTDCPGMQIYTGNHFDGNIKGKQGVNYKRYAGICFETQQFPNAVNIRSFPNCVVKKNKKFVSKTSYKFCII